MSNILTLHAINQIENEKREAWLAERKQGIGGSDAAAILGLSPYRTPMEVWLEKTGRSEPSFNEEQLERMRWGNLLESVVAGEYALRYRATLREVSDTLWHPDYPHAFAHPDRVRVPRPDTQVIWDGYSLKGADLLIEIKTARAGAPGWGEPGTDEIPDSYLVQVQWYLGITGLESAHVVVLFGGQKLQVYSVERDDEFIHMALDQAEAWWQRHVEADMPPEPQTEADVKRLWPRHKTGKTVEASPEVQKAALRLKEVKQQLSLLQEEEKELRDSIVSFLGDAEALTVEGKKVLTFKANRDSRRTDWKAVAEACGASKELIENHTTVKPGSRVLRLLG